MVYFREVQRLWIWVLPAVWFSLGKLVAEGRETTLSIRFHLLWPERLIPWSEIRGAEAVTYFSGRRGVRWGARGVTYSVSGSRGVRIELAGGGSVLVGSQRADELADAIGQRIGGPGGYERWGEDSIQP